MGTIRLNDQAGNVVRYGLRGIAVLDFVIESGVFNAFLLQEALQLVTTTMTCTKKAVEFQAYEAFKKQADKEIFHPLMKNYFDQEWTIAFGKEGFRKVFVKMGDEYLKSTMIG